MPGSAADEGPSPIAVLRVVGSMSSGHAVTDGAVVAMGLAIVASSASDMTTYGSAITAIVSGATASATVGGAGTGATGVVGAAGAGVVGACPAGAGAVPLGRLQFK